MFSDEQVSRVRAMIEGCGYSEAKKDEALRWLGITVALAQESELRRAVTEAEAAAPRPFAPQPRKGEVVATIIQERSSTLPERTEWRVEFPHASSQWGGLTIAHDGPEGAKLDALLHAIALQLAANVKGPLPASVEGWKFTEAVPMCWRCRKEPGLVGIGVGDSRECVQCATVTFRTMRKMLDDIAAAVRDGLRAYPRIMDRVEFVRECVRMQREEAVLEAHANARGIER
jgi:hypothetical protein